MQSSSKFSPRSVRTAMTGLVAMCLLASAAGAVNFTRAFPYVGATFQQGSFRAVSTCALRNDSLGFELSIDYQSGTIGAGVQALDRNGGGMATAGDIDIRANRCKPTPDGVPCKVNFQSPVNPASVRLFIL